MKKFIPVIFAFCVLAGLLIFPAARSASANGGEPDAQSEFREDKIGLTPMEKFATEMTYLIGEKIADMLDEIAASVESRAERKKSRQKGENRAGFSPDDPKGRPSEGAKSTAPGFAGIFSTLMREAANSVRKYLVENVLPKLPLEGLLVKIPAPACHAAA